MKPTDETVERVARAILQGHDWTHDGGDDPALPTGWESVRPDWQDAYRAMARAAIAAMPEPWVMNDAQLKEVLGFLNSIAGHGYGGMASFEIARAYVKDALNPVSSGCGTPGCSDPACNYANEPAPSPPQKDDQPSPAALLKP